MQLRAGSLEEEMRRREVGREFDPLRPRHATSYLVSRSP
jgi:hypothetical protein